MISIEIKVRRSEFFMGVNNFNVNLEMKNKIHLEMKNKIQILITAILLLLTGFAKAQGEKINIDLVIGTSIPELYHLGVRIHYIPNARLDFNFGSDFINDDNGRLYEATINHAIYFGKVNPRTDTKLWSINSGFSFLVEETVLLKSTAGYLNLFFARELRITKKLYIQPEAGASYFLFEQLVNQDNIATKGYRTRIVPKFGLNLIIKI
jgi:hypothetical protein